MDMQKKYDSLNGILEYIQHILRLIRKWKICCVYIVEKIRRKIKWEITNIWRKILVF